MRIFSFRSLLLPFSLVALAACHRAPIGQSRLAPAAPVIDGKTDEWGGAELQYDEKSKLHYQVVNDGRNVYVRLKTTDPAAQNRIVLQGLTVWLDSAGRNKQQFGVRYPRGGVNIFRSLPAPPPTTPAERQQKLAQVLLNQTQMALLKYKGNTEPTITDTHTLLGIQAATAFDAQGALIYELAVPLRVLYKKTASYAASQAPVVGVSITSVPLPSTNAGIPGYSVMGGPGGMGGRGGRGGQRGKKPAAEAGKTQPKTDASVNTNKQGKNIGLKTTAKLAF